MEWINGVLKIKVNGKIYNLNEDSEIIYDGIEYHCDILYKKIKIPKYIIRKLHKNGLIFVLKNDVSNIKVIYKVKQSNNNYIKIKQELYYRGLNWATRTYCYNKEILDGNVIVKCGNGVNRKEEDILNNKCDVYINKEDVNKTLIGVYMSEFIK